MAGVAFLAKAAAEKGATKTASGIVITTLTAGTGASPIVAEEARAREAAVLLKVEQVGRVFPFPVTVTIRYANGTLEDVSIAVAGRTTEVRLPLKGDVREITLNRDGLTPLVITGQ